MARDVQRGSAGRTTAAALRDSGASLVFRPTRRVGAEALQLPGKHLVDLRRELGSSPVREAGGLIVERQLRTACHLLDLYVHDAGRCLVEQGAERAGHYDTLARLHECDAHVLHAATGL